MTKENPIKIWPFATDYDLMCSMLTKAIF